eukprot:114141-Rhodomonas_salina.2
MPEARNCRTKHQTAIKDLGGTLRISCPSTGIRISSQRSNPNLLSLKKIESGHTKEFFLDWEFLRAYPGNLQQLYWYPPVPVLLLVLADTRAFAWRQARADFSPGTRYRYPCTRVVGHPVGVGIPRSQ